MKGKKLITLIVDVAVLLFLMYLVFHNDCGQIIYNIKNISFRSQILLLFMGSIYFSLDALVLRYMLKSLGYRVSYMTAIDLNFISVFCAVATFAAGIIPAQSYYLYRKGINPGDSIGILIAKYIINKISLTFLSAIVLLSAAHSLFDCNSNLMSFALIAWVINAAICVALVLICLFGGVRKAVEKAISKLPSSEKWMKIKEKLLININYMYCTVKNISNNPKVIFIPFIINLVKYIVLNSITYAALWAIEETSLDYLSTISLTCISQIIAGALPNIAGLGPTELGIIAIFSNFIPISQTSSILILYRTATYFFPFICSCVAVYFIKKKITPRRQN